LNSSPFIAIGVHYYITSKCSMQPYSPPSPGECRCFPPGLIVSACTLAADFVHPCHKAAQGPRGAPGALQSRRRRGLVRPDNVDMALPEEVHRSPAAAASAGRRQSGFRSERTGSLLIGRAWALLGRFVAARACAACAAGSARRWGCGRPWFRGRAAAR